MAYVNIIGSSLRIDVDQPLKGPNREYLNRVTQYLWAIWSTCSMSSFLQPCLSLSVHWRVIKIYWGVGSGMNNTQVIMVWDLPWGNLSSVKGKDWNWKISSVLEKYIKGGHQTSVWIMKEKDVFEWGTTRDELQTLKKVIQPKYFYIKRWDPSDHESEVK